MPKQISIGTIAGCGMLGGFLGAVIGYIMVRNAVSGLDVGLFGGLAVGFLINMIQMSKSE